MIVAEDSRGLGKKQRFYREIVSAFFRAGRFMKETKDCVFMERVKYLIRKMKTFCPSVKTLGFKNKNKASFTEEKQLVPHEPTTHKN